jgi:predicted CopG family antitoxin
VNQRTIGLITWAILANARNYSPFYPELQEGEEAALLRKGLFYVHPAAENVFEQGDPRAALVRYWENNSDLQAGVFILGATSMVGFLFQRWRKERSKKLLNTTINQMNDLKMLLSEDPQQALQGIEDLRQEHRLRFIDNTVTSEIYEELQQKTQTFSDQCRTLIEQQRKKIYFRHAAAARRVAGNSANRSRNRPSKADPD